MMGLEPMTSSLPRKCSTAELHRLMYSQPIPVKSPVVGLTGLLQKHIASGRRVSNPQPIAWKAIALPIELLPLVCGGRRIRTFEAEATDLQSVPFDRSGIPPILSPLPGSNQRPTDYKSVALPAELRRRSHFK